VTIISTVRGTAKGRGGVGKRYPACIFMCESAGWPGRLRTKKSDAKITSILKGQGKIQDNASMPRNRSVASVPDRRERMVGGRIFSV
jgi:hypothetical protein